MRKRESKREERREAQEREAKDEAREREICAMEKRCI